MCNYLKLCGLIFVDCGNFVYFRGCNFFFFILGVCCCLVYIVNDIINIELIENLVLFKDISFVNRIIIMEFVE